jgi:hypothetical protein
VYEGPLTTGVLCSRELWELELVPSKLMQEIGFRCSSEMVPGGTCWRYPVQVRGCYEPGQRRA